MEERKRKSPGAIKEKLNHSYSHRKKFAAGNMINLSFWAQVS